MGYLLIRRAPSYVKICFFLIAVILVILCLSYYYTPTKVKDQEKFLQVDRSDFVGEYAGWTEAKTRTLLEESRGKVLFIDEAYNLVTDERDSFGKVALTALNKFMSENPDEIIVIFAGYHDR